MTASPGRIRASAPDDRRKDELVGLSALVGGRDRVGRRVDGRRLSDAVHDGVEGELRAVPAAVAVHAVVAAADRAEARARLARRGLIQPALHLSQIARARIRRGVAAVCERVQHDVGHRQIRGQLDARAQVAHACVDPAARDQPHQVQPPRPPAPRRRRRSGPRFPRTRHPPRRRRSGSGPGGQPIPAPRLRWPTSELPIWPSGRPTARPQVVSVLWAQLSQRESKTGVSASSTALPGPGAASPQPSRTTRQTAGTGGEPGPAPVTRRRPPRSRPDHRDEGSPRRPVRRPHRAARGSLPRSPASR